jgi:dienelactone hydrolase
MSPDDPPPWLPDLRHPPASVPDDATRPAPLLFDAHHQPITTRDAWQGRRAELVRAWRGFLGEIPPSREPPRLGVIEEDLIDDGAILRRRVSHESEPGEEVEAYLLLPASDPPPGGRPGAVVLHSTTDATIRQPSGLDGPDDLHIGVHLARRGYVAFCPRNFLWTHGTPGKIGSGVDWFQARHPDAKGMAKMLFDARRAVDALLTRPDVDRRRVAAIGHSLGGKEVLYLAAFDDRIRASVSCEGGIGLTYSNWDAPWYLTDAINRPGFGLDHGQVLALAAPRAFLLVGGDSADGAKSWPYIEAALPVWRLNGAPDAVGLLNHGQGHAFPPAARERAYAWLDWFLRD